MKLNTETFNKHKYIYLCLLIASLIGGYIFYKWSEGGRWVDFQFRRPGYFFKGKEKELAIAAERGNIKKINQLVKNGVNLNAVGKSNDGKDEATILQWAVFSWATGAKNLNAIERLLQFGADPNFIINDGSSVMYNIGASVMYSSTVGGVLFLELGSNVSLLRLLLKYGGNPNIRNPVERNILSDNKPVLIYAVQLGAFKNIKILLQHGADINITDGFKLTPLLWAAANNHFDIAYYLLQHGADYKKFGYRPLYIRHTINSKYGMQEIIAESLRCGLSDDQKPWREKVIKWLEARRVKIPAATSENFHNPKPYKKDAPFFLQEKNNKADAEWIKKQREIMHETLTKPSKEVLKMRDPKLNYKILTPEGMDVGNFDDKEN